MGLHINGWFLLLIVPLPGLTGTGRTILVLCWTKDSASLVCALIPAFFTLKLLTLGVIVPLPVAEQLQGFYSNLFTVPKGNIWPSWTWYPWTSTFWVQKFPHGIDHVSLHFPPTRRAPVFPGHSGCFFAHLHFPSHQCYFCGLWWSSICICYSSFWPVQGYIGPYECWPLLSFTSLLACPYCWLSGWSAIEDHSI